MKKSKVLSLFLSAVILLSTVTSFNMISLAESYDEENVKIVKKGNYYIYTDGKNHGANTPFVYILLIGDTLELSAPTPPYSRDWYTTSLNWSIADTNVICYTKNSGTDPVTIVGHGPGETIITGERGWFWSNPIVYGQYDSGTARWKDAVRVAGYVEEITLSDSQITLSPGQSKTISVISAKPDDVFTKYFNTLHFVSTNPDVATVDENGNINAVSSGTATIQSRSYYGKYDLIDPAYGSCIVTVKDPSAEAPSDSGNTNNSAPSTSSTVQPSTPQTQPGTASTANQTATTQAKPAGATKVGGEWVASKQKNTKIKKLTKAKKSFKATWSKVTGVTGYQVQYATDKNFKKNKKTVTISKQKTTSTTVKKLKANKKYYVRIRTYKNVKLNGKTVKVYSKWSSAKTVITK